MSHRSTLSRSLRRLGSTISSAVRHETADFKILAAKLNISEDKIKKGELKKALKDNNGNEAAAINVLFPRTFKLPLKPTYTEAEIDDAILNRQVKDQTLRRNKSFKTSILDIESTYGPIFTGEIDKIKHYLAEQDLIPQMEFIYKKFDEPKFKKAIKAYMGTDFNDMNDLLNGKISNISLLPEIEEYCCTFSKPGIKIPIERIVHLKKLILSLKKLLRDIKPITHDLIVYRCWKYGLPNYIEEPSNSSKPYEYKQFLSTAMFKDFSLKWCNGGNPAIRKFMRITIPAGSRVLPLIDYDKFVSDGFSPDTTEYEILISDHGKLINEKKITDETITVRTNNVDIEVTMPTHHFRYDPPTPDELGAFYALDDAEERHLGTEAGGGGGVRKRKYMKHYKGRRTMKLNKKKNKRRIYTRKRSIRI